MIRLQTTQMHSYLSDTYEGEIYFHLLIVRATINNSILL